MLKHCKVYETFILFEEVDVDLFQHVFINCSLSDKAIYKWGIDGQKLCINQADNTIKPNAMHLGNPNQVNNDPCLTCLKNVYVQHADRQLLSIHPPNIEGKKP